MPRGYVYVGNECCFRMRTNYHEISGVLRSLHPVKVIFDGATGRETQFCRSAPISVSDLAIVPAYPEQSIMRALINEVLGFCLCVAGTPPPPKARCALRR